MRSAVARLAAAAILLSSCAAPAPPSAPSGRTSGTPVAIATGSPAASQTFCPGRTWPPYPVGGFPGLEAASIDRATVAITNGTGMTWYYRVSGWQPAEFETCRALAELEVVRGPIAPGATERVTVDPTWRQAGVPVTIAFWDEPCGEGCQREPVAAIGVELSALEPAAS
jgi:hypothetical protein